MNQRTAFSMIVLVYFVPSVIACLRRAARRDLVIAVNLLLGWTVVVWVLCLWEAITGRRTPR